MKLQSRIGLPTNIRLGWKRNVGEKHSSLLRKFANYRQKKFYNIGPWSSIKHYGFLLYRFRGKLVCFSKPFKGNDNSKTLAYYEICQFFIIYEPVIFCSTGLWVLFYKNFKDCNLFLRCKFPGPRTQC